MITFTCGNCDRSFTVPDAFAGRKAKCKSCGAPVTVPAPANSAVATFTPAAASAPPAAPESPLAASGGESSTSLPAPVRVPMRVRRLRADAEQMRSAFDGFPAIRVVEARGEPPEMYRIEYHVNGLERPAKMKQQPPVRERHEVEIQLTGDYPRTSPKCRMLTPIFHPNIDPATICIGDHWTAGERLVDLTIRIGEMISYQAYNVKSPLDAEAAMWADLHQAELPVDPRPLRPPGLD